jgi:protein-S-isoprenylcysteine O-methyltransferase Ste14
MPKMQLSAAARRIDVFTRMLASSFFLMMVFAKAAELITIARGAMSQAAPLHFEFYATFASRVVIVLFFSLIAVLFIVREKPLKKASGLKPRLLAIVGTFLIPFMGLFPRVELGLTWTISSTLLVVVGTALSVYSLYHLGRSFSLMAEARRLVTNGPYAIVRHPLYLCEQIAILGTLMQYLSPITIGIFMVHLWIQFQRMSYEEKLLRSTFPDYSEYATRTTAKFLPGVC